MTSIHRRVRGQRQFARAGAAALCAAAVLGAVGHASAQELAVCRSPNPADWPAPAKPYFMIAFDTSGSMDDDAGPDPSCSGYPDSRLGHARCALSNMIQAYAGQVNFGLATFPRRIQVGGGGTPPSTCPDQLGVDLSFSVSGCQLTNLFSSGTCGGTGTGANARAANILVPLQQDDYFNSPPSSASNVAELLSWVDNRCGDCKELFSSGWTPLNGILRDTYRYLSTEWSAPSGTPTYLTPLTGGERPCRSVNVILMTDGEETCDPNRESTNPGNPNAVQAAAAAAQLLAGWDIGPIHWTARTHVIAMASGTGLLASANNIANNGGTGTAYLATNEAQLSQALSTIIAGSIRPEVCDNTDNNCNGCTDEGHQTFCNRNKTPRTVAQLTAGGNVGQCCSGARATCLQNFNASISPSNPTGDRWWLPCWNPATDNTSRETKWLCSNPGEVCDNADNNCELDIDPPDLSTNVADEGFNKCPNCPVPETCDGADQNCDGVIDNAPGNMNPFTVTAECRPCIPSTEICDGCDNDCDGDIDEDVPAISCGLPSPARCAGQQTCVEHLGVPPGTCLPGGGSFGACNNNPGSETCNGIDDNCDGLVDNNPSGVGGNCVPTAGLPTQGECRPGTRICVNGTIQCVGYVGPTPEICDGLDNDCDGLIDAADPDLTGLGQECGTAAGQCRKGTTACVGGVIVCQGGNQPQPEICNGLDDDCNGATDDGTLADAPSNPACWPNPADTCNPTPACTHQGYRWCPPPGGTCKGVGTLTTPCATGTLGCAGPDGWKCQGGRGPAGEVCDGADNDCNGQVDEQLGSPIGDPCGTDVGECQSGTNACENGSVVCNGGIGPVAEICDNLDNDCDTVIDNGIVLGAPCEVSYDTTLYPGPRDQGVCAPGVTECDGMGSVVCTGGKGPSPEICDGLDNDCDGLIDESGPPPDGIDGTADPMDSTRVIGAPCGVNEGECLEGELGCFQGRVECVGERGPQPEICDCLDNDCDGTVDEIAEPGEDPICGTGRTCVELGAGSGFCQCAPPCTSNEFLSCPTGLSCTSEAVKSGTNDPAGLVCVQAGLCQRCSEQTVTRMDDDTVECAPRGSQGTGGRPIPACVCKGNAGCRSPCLGVQCADGLSCSPITGRCQDEGRCGFFGCPPGDACDGSVCVENPCKPDSCPGEVCKPNLAAGSFECVPSCVGVACAPSEICVDGVCEESPCGQPCPEDQVCLAAQGDAGAATCGESPCNSSLCTDGRTCDPATGDCIADPCAGVLCPAPDQYCEAGQCVRYVPPGGVGGAGGASGTGGSSGAGPDAGVGGSAGGKTERENGVFGLATGGGGCSCEVPGKRPISPLSGGALLGVGVALTFVRRRRNKSALRAEGVR